MSIFFSRMACSSKIVRHRARLIRQLEGKGFTMGYSQRNSTCLGFPRVIMKLRLTVVRDSIVRCRRVIFSTCLLLLLFTMACAQKEQPGNKMESDNLYLIIQNRKFGFIDGQGRVVIKPQFLMASPFSEGLAAVLVGDEGNYKTAFIDRSGRILFETKDSSSE